MNETQNEKELQSPEAQTITPEKTDNVKSEISDNLNDSAKPKEGQSEKEKDPSAELILGKFKSVEELSKAYEELQKHQGKCSEELGSLRKELANFNDCKNLAESLENYRNAITSVVARDKELYDTPEYLQNPIFKEIYSEALMTYGDNLDTDRLIGLLEKYVENRILSHDKENSAKSETQNVLDSMIYSDNPKNTLTPPKKTLDEMTDEEFKASLRKLI